ncbi:MAG: pitrilysin family protein [Alphaproteobacteria bacterium]|nr:pitrilysin family protein [Alphaproteobacteria bacterium]
MRGWVKYIVIPAKAGIHRRASARHMSPAAGLSELLFDLYARHRSRWIPAFAGKTAAFILIFCSLTAHAAVFYPTNFTLSNGLQVVVVPNPLAPVVSQMVWYKVGAADEVKGKNGLAHYLEHLMFRGTANIPAGEFSKMIAGQGGQDNAFTSYDYTAYYETVEASRLPMIMQMEADRMQNLRITEETAGPELHVVLDERQQRTDNSPEGRFYEKFDHKFMPHYPYGRPVIGWKREIEKLTPEDAREFYETHYAPNNAVVVISGDVKVEDVMRLAAATYGRVPKREVAKRHVFGPAPKPKTHEFTSMDVGVEQPEVVWRFAVPSYATQKNGEAYAYEVLAEALDDGEVGVLYQKLVTGQGIASAVESSYDPDARGETSFTLAASPRPGVTYKKLEKAMHKVLADSAKKGLEAQTVEDAKRRLQRSAIFAREGLMMPGYAFGMALTTGHRVADVEAWPDHINAVTVDQVNVALRDLAGTPRQLMGALLPDPHATPASREAAQPLIGHETGIR